MPLSVGIVGLPNVGPKQNYGHLVSDFVRGEWW